MSGQLISPFTIETKMERLELHVYGLFRLMPLEQKLVRFGRAC